MEEAINVYKELSATHSKVLKKVIIARIAEMRGRSWDHLSVESIERRFTLEEVIRRVEGEKLA